MRFVGSTCLLATRDIDISENIYGEESNGTSVRRTHYSERGNLHSGLGARNSRLLRALPRRPFLAIEFRRYCEGIIGEN